MKSLFVTAHPDDELLFAHAIRAQSEAHVLVSSFGESSTIDHIGNRFCRLWR